MIRSLLVFVTVFVAAPSAWAAALGRPCVCDCDADGAVTVDEIVLATNLALTGGAGACASSDTDGSGSIDVAEILGCMNPALSGCPLPTRADAAFWDTLGLVADREEESISLYEQAIAANPSDARSWFLKGMMHFYRFGKELTDYENFNEQAKQEIALATEALDRAVELDPANRAYPGFRGGAIFQRGLAQEDPELRDLGLQQLRDSVELWGFFNRFSFLGTVGVAVPAHDPLYDESLNLLLASVSSQALGECTPNFCGNAGKAPSNLGGTALLFGDLFAKGGDANRARFWYGLGNSASYRFVSLLRERSQNVAARVALYNDDDPSNDPQVVGLGAENCVICHAR